MKGSADEPLSLPQPYEEIPHTADVALRAFGETREEALCRLVLALASTLSGGGPVEAGRESTITVEPGEPALMAIDVLREVLYAFSTEGSLPASCGVVRFEEQSGTEIEVALGDFDEELHAGGTDVKAVTFHDARFERLEDGTWLAQVILDI